MSVNVCELYELLTEYAKINDSTLNIYRTNTIFTGIMPKKSDMLEIKRKRSTDILIRMYNTDQHFIDLHNTEPINVLGISFLRNSQNQKTDTIEYIIDSIGNIDRFNKIESLPNGIRIKEIINEKESLREKLFYLFDHHDKFY